MTIVALLVLTTPTLATARTWHVPTDAPTIQAGIDLAAPGDDVLVAPGEYFEHSIVMKGGVWVHSEEDSDVTTVNATGNGTGFIFTDLQPTTVLEGFTILNGFADSMEEHDGSGGGVRCIQSSLMIHDCVITGCVANVYGGGIYSWESGLQVENCRVSGCQGDAGGGGIAAGYPSTIRITDCEIFDNEAYSIGGILALGSEVTIVRCVVSGNVASWGSIGGIGCYSPMLTIQDCLITDNWEVTVDGASGLYVDRGSSGSISGCTVASNRGWRVDDPAVEISDSEIQINRLVIAFNEGRALRCAGSQVSVHCSDLYGNTAGNDLCGTDLGGNFSLDPLFCDPENGDYTLDGCSPCLPGNHPHGVDCGLIGALGQGCGATAVEETSWGRVKSLYRR